MDVTLWLAFAAASTALLLVPGPTVLLVMSYAMSQGRRVAVASAAGVAAGDALAMTASLAGLGALVMASATLFTALKWIGAAYLIFMGVKLWRSAGTARLESPGDGRAVSAREVFGQAALVTALNPKSIVFFIAFVPQFVRPTEPLLPQFAILVTTFATLNALAYALLADRLRSGLRRPAVIGAITRAGAAALVAMGVATALTRRSA